MFYKKNFKIIVLVSANGSGKGTFGKYISSIDKSYINIDAGDILRDEISKKTEFGQKVQAVYEDCKYLDESIDKIIWDKLIVGRLKKVLSENKITILDGCFRSKMTFDLLDSFLRENNLLKDTCIIQFIASDETFTKRILARRICPNCKTGYNNLLCKLGDFCESGNICRPGEFCKSGDFNKCPKCFVGLEVRKSDTIEFTQERLRYFHQVVEPILEIAKKEYQFLAINTECEIELLHKKYRDFLCNKFFY
jgi:adenylate kinase family enzyme